LDLMPAGHQLDRRASARLITVDGQTISGRVVGAQIEH
jgi:hypothetical protein